MLYAWWDEIHSNQKGEKVWNFISVKGEERITVLIIEHADKYYPSINLNHGLYP
jgi:hypothetical protein